MKYIKLKKKSQTTSTERKAKTTKENKKLFYKVLEDLTNGKAFKVKIMKGMY